MAEAPLTIGKLACSAGGNVETVRYYQRQGLIIEPEKPAYGFRYYPAEIVTRIQFIKRAQRPCSVIRIRKVRRLNDDKCVPDHQS